MDMGRTWFRQPAGKRRAGARRRSELPQSLISDVWLNEAACAGRTASRAACLVLLTLCLAAAGCSRGPERAESGTAAATADSGERRTVDSDDTGVESGAAGAPGDRLQVAATIFPYYDFVRQIAGDLVDLRLVVPAGMDSHSFEPTPADMRAIRESDVLIANGGIMEQWVGRVLEAVDAPDLTVVTMMDHADVYREETVEGMEDEEQDHGQRDVSPDDGYEEEIEYDEHIWTSPVNAMEFVNVIADTLSREDPANAEAYAAGAERYLEELQSIHEGFLAVSEARRRDMIVVGDKFPFRYLAEEYGLTYRAAFSGCSTDTEPSARTIAYLIDKVREEQIPAVYYLELSSHRVAEIIGEETGAQPLLLHSCHNVTRAELNAGVTYADLMRGNIESLRKGLDE